MNKTIRLAQLFAIVCLLFVSANSEAVWFEATGQAVIHNNNKQLARQAATQEAIKQALLFSGASIRSVQSMAHGLLQDDRLEVRASGEVSSIELVDEIYSDDYVSITIRADIFPQDAQCHASDYKKSLVSAWFPLINRQQARFGNLFDLGKPTAMRLQEEFSLYADHATITKVESLYLSPNEHDSVIEAMSMARKTNNQFVLIGAIQNLGVAEIAPKYVDYLTFWDDKNPTRHIAIQVQLIDGATGELLIDKIYRTAAEWDFDKFSSVDVTSEYLWRSEFGTEMKHLLQNIAQDVDEAVRCLPAYGRIINVSRNKLSANLGKIHGVKQGDLLKVFQMRQVFSASGTTINQYDIHPATVKVVKVFHNSSVLHPTNALTLGNIQPNDFVVRQ